MKIIIANIQFTCIQFFRSLARSIYTLRTASTRNVGLNYTMMDKQSSCLLLDFAKNGLTSNFTRFFRIPSAWFRQMDDFHGNERENWSNKSGQKRMSVVDTTSKNCIRSESSFQEERGRGQTNVQCWGYDYELIFGAFFLLFSPTDRRFSDSAIKFLNWE